MSLLISIRTYISITTNSGQLLQTEAVMAPSRRMQKQGPPAPLDESKFGSKKRKNGATTTSAFKKQKVAPAPGKTAKSQAKIVTNGRSKKPQAPVRAAEDESDLSGDAIDDPDVLEDELEGVEAADLDDLGDEELLDDRDDFDLAPSGSDDEDVVDSDQEIQKGIWSDEDSDAEEQLTAANIVGLSKQLDRQRAEEAAENEAELAEDALQTNIAADLDLDGGEDGIKSKTNLLAPDMQLLRTRITETIRVLSNMKELQDKSKSRADYTQALIKDICIYYGYSQYLAEKLFSLFPPQEALAFFDANETPRPVVLRTNTLRTSRRELAHTLINRGVTLEPVGKWSKVGLQVFESQVPLGATPEYLAGHYILQAASSFLPVMALAPQEHERVLDMAAAPGGKSTYLAALMRNTGVIFANDASKERSKGLIGNIHRLGVKNTIVCNYSALEFPKVMGGFDRVLLDAPCSGTGVIAKDASVKTNKTEADFLRLPHLQKQLLLAAIDSVDHASKTGGYIVYSTCSVTVEENEQVVQYALNKRPNVKLVETGLVFGREGFVKYESKRFHPSLKMTRRYYPHSYNVDGFYVAKFKKTGPTPANATKPQGTAQPASNKVDEIIADDHAAIVDDETEQPEDPFGGFDDEEDNKFIEQGIKNQMRKKGINPKATKSKAVQSLLPSSSREKTKEDKQTAPVETEDPVKSKTSVGNGVAKVDGSKVNGKKSKARKAAA